jgi:hypothetical protein
MDYFGDESGYDRHRGGCRGHQPPVLPPRRELRHAMESEPAKAKAKAVNVHGLPLPLLPPALVSDFFCLVRHPRLLELPEQSEHEVVSGIE